MGYNPQKSTWLNPNIEYLFNAEITEYDIQDAGFNLIKQYKLLPESKIKELELMAKGSDRHIAVGIIQRDDKVFAKALSDKFAEIRTIFVSANNLTDNDILSVKKDAIYTIGPCDRLKFGMINFVPKNRYTSYLRFPDIQNLEIYYSSDTMDVKGIGDSAINRHRLYMMEFIRTVISLVESKSPRVKRYIINFVKDYKDGDLDETFYLEFNNVSRNIDVLFNFQKVIVPIISIILREME